GCGACTSPGVGRRDAGTPRARVRWSAGGDRVARLACSSTRAAAAPHRRWGAAGRKLPGSPRATPKGEPSALPELLPRSFSTFPCPEFFRTPRDPMLPEAWRAGVPNRQSVTGFGPKCRFTNGGALRAHRPDRVGGEDHEPE